jgi:hypothetical protein
MKTNCITELFKIEALPATTNVQMIAAADVINGFLCEQDGFIDAELVRAMNGSAWYFIYHIENGEKLKIVGEKLRNSKLLDNLTTLIVPGSMSVTFFSSLKSWTPSFQSRTLLSQDAAGLRSE